jgi:hypothetical protein
LGRRPPFCSITKDLWNPQQRSLLRPSPRHAPRGHTMSRRYAADRHTMLSDAGPRSKERLELGLERRSFRRQLGQLVHKPRHQRHSLRHLGLERGVVELELGSGALKLCLRTSYSAPANAASARSCTFLASMAMFNAFAAAPRAFAFTLASIAASPASSVGSSSAVASSRSMSSARSLVANHAPSSGGTLMVSFSEIMQQPQ